jgi:hypothetical protein
MEKKVSNYSISIAYPAIKHNILWRHRNRWLSQIAGIIIAVITSYVLRLSSVFNANFFLKKESAEMLHRRFILLNLVAVLLLFAWLFVGCGGSSSSDPAGATVSGVVADGYLSGARVFLDLNDNRIWDTGEPYATSDANGNYTISEITAEDYNSYPVVAEVTVTTTDEDTGKPVSHPYTLVSPAGHPEFISPLTTMVQVSYESNPDITLDEACAAVKEMLSMEDAVEVDLFSNYVEEKDDADAAASDYAKLHNIAQLSARIMGANISALETAADGAGLALDEAKDEILRMAVKAIMQSMDLIEDAATEDPDFDADQGVQALAIDVDITDIENDIEAEQTAMQYQAPSLSWATVFRNHQSGGFNDMLCLALEHDLDLTGYTFTVEGPDGTEYNFEEADRDNDPSAPISWYKSYDSLPQGEYKFYITVPGGQKIKVAKDTHAHTDIPALSLATAEVVNVTGADSRVYHDLLDGTYYYRMAIKENASGVIVYRTKRRERNIQYFPSQYSTGDYAYRIEVWDHPLLKDTTARFRTQWEDINPAGTTTDTYIEFFKGYRRIRIGEDGTPSPRIVLQIGITNPSDLLALTLTGPGGFSYSFDLTRQPGDEVANDDTSPRTYFLRGSGTTQDGKAYADYFLMLRGTPPSGDYAWQATTASGNDFTRSIAIYDQTALPGVDPDSVSVTEDQYGDITFDWDAVDWSGKPVFYRVGIVKDEDWDNMYFSQRIPGTTWTGSRDAIEAVIGGPLNSVDVGYSIHVIDSQYYSTVHNRTDFAPVSLVIN